MNMTSKLNSIIVALILGLLTIGCSTKEVSSTWSEKPVVVDGLSDDWNSESLQYEEELNLVYGVSNDQSKLHIFIRFSDRALTKRIDMLGMVIWFDKEKTRGIRYLDEMAYDKMRERIFSGSGRRQLPLRDRDPELPGMLNGTFFWLDGDYQSLIDKNDGDLYKATSSISNGNFGLEYEVDLNMISMEKQFYAGIELSGVDDEIKEAIEERRNAGRGRGGISGGPGMGGGRPSGRRMGGGMRPDGNRQPDLDSKEFWVKVNLAEQEDI